VVGLVFGDVRGLGEALKCTLRDYCIKMSMLVSGLSGTGMSIIWGKDMYRKLKSK
jgi:hypothetical protein